MDLIKEVIIIGGGQAGLSASYYLRKEGINHIVLEQNEVGSSWIFQRWNSFKMNTPNWMTGLPGMALPEEIREHFMTKDEFVVYLKRYVQLFQLPVKEDCKVLQLHKTNNHFVVITETDGKQIKWTAEKVIIASGMMNKVKLPHLSRSVPQNIKQLHASEYKNPEQLPEGNILVVGAAQSGCQIAEELALAGRKIYLASSKVARAPRRYKGKDVMEWMDLMGIQNITPELLHANPKLNASQPQSSGMGLLGKTISYQSLHHLGVTVLGSLKEIQDVIFYFGDNVRDHIQFADETSANIKKSIDVYLHENRELPVPEEDTDTPDIPDQQFTSASDIHKLNGNNDISAVIWATGFGYDFSYMDTALLDESKKPIHKGGKIDNGLYCLGFPWLRKKKSGLVYGLQEDAEMIVKEIVENKI